MRTYEIKGFTPPFDALRPCQWNIAEREGDTIKNLIGPFRTKRAAKAWIAATAEDDCDLADALTALPPPALTPKPWRIA